MNDFKVGDKVVLILDEKERDHGTVRKVGDTCLYCVKEDGDIFHSHKENFAVDKEVVPVDFKVGDRVRGLGGKEAVVERVGGNWLLYVVNEDDNSYYGLKDDFIKIQDGKRVLIGITGRKGSGKDTAAQALDGFVNIKMAGALKAMVRAFMSYVGVPDDIIERCVEGDMKESPMACWDGRTTRYVMQTLGTEWGRDNISTDLWVNAFKAKARQHRKVVCTDVRFPNEVQAMHEEGGYVVRIKRPMDVKIEDTHPSEAGIDYLIVNANISNSGSVEQLHAMMRKAVALAEGGNTSAAPRTLGDEDSDDSIYGRALLPLTKTERSK